ncbi:MAG: DNA-binding domain-containing protein [Burkholderiaceae bacterium]|nr:DNA-binding domain-containing protein [Burkholderiaceae bacterium]
MSLSLLSVQLQFQQHMLGVGDALPLIAGDPERQQLGLRIYAHAYRQRLLDTLIDSYEKTLAVMGEAAFESAALAYIAVHPPTTRSLRWYGDGFDAHLAAGGADLPASSAWAELASLDWALRGAFDGPDSAVLDASAFAELPPEAWATLSLVPVPTTQLLTLRHNTVAVWQALDDDQPPPDLQASEMDVVWVVWRKGHQPHFRSLHRAEATLLRAMLDGAPFAAACSQAEAAVGEERVGDGRTDDDMSMLIGGFMRQWLEDGLLARILL